MLRACCLIALTAVAAALPATTQMEATAVFATAAPPCNITLRNAKCGTKDCAEPKHWYSPPPGSGQCHPDSEWKATYICCAPPTPTPAPNSTTPAPGPTPAPNSTTPAPDPNATKAPTTLMPTLAPTSDPKTLDAEVVFNVDPTKWSNSTFNGTIFITDIATAVVEEKDRFTIVDTAATNDTVTVTVQIAAEAPKYKSTADEVVQNIIASFNKGDFTKIGVTAASEVARTAAPTSTPTTSTPTASPTSGAVRNALSYLLVLGSAAAILL